ncbi:hypothetical protein P7K49_021035 [Saguinus oedipus]|uniref:Uncharacterized protein n=1 Tax=Saguinus oedipus TaxID=9490 RepID=A0ABQ9URJ6_SAGOE|nr:hypothetical protein P7K49_021035 [Saguinus oedipus]
MLLRTTRVPHYLLLDERRGWEAAWLPINPAAPSELAGSWRGQSGPAPKPDPVNMVLPALRHNPNGGLPWENGGLKPRKHLGALLESRQSRQRPLGWQGITGSANGDPDKYRASPECVRRSGGPYSPQASVLSASELKTPPPRGEQAANAVGRGRSQARLSALVLAEPG